MAPQHQQQQHRDRIPPSPAPDSQPPSPRVDRNVSFDQDNITRTASRQRRPSNGERINGILQTARVRAEAMGSSQSTPTAVDGIVDPDNRGQDGYSSADEHTGIVMRGPDRNYQTMSPNGPDGDAGSKKGDDGARARRPAGSRRSAASSRTELSPPAEDVGEDDDGPRGAANTGRRRDKRRKPRQDKSWHKGYLSHFASIELENKGSVARDHLALERTFLAWLRTSLAFASIGIAVTQLFRLNTSLADADGSHAEDSGDATLRRLGKPLGATFLAISIIILFLGYHRYFNAQRWIIAGKFPASRGTIIAVAFVAFAVMMASLVVVIVVHPRVREV